MPQQEPLKTTKTMTCVYTYGTFFFSIYIYIYTYAYITYIYTHEILCLFIVFHRDMRPSSIFCASQESSLVQALLFSAAAIVAAGPWVPRKLRRDPVFFG